MGYQDEVSADIARLQEAGALAAAFHLGRLWRENQELRRRLAELSGPEHVELLHRPRHMRRQSRSSAAALGAPLVAPLFFLAGLAGVLRP